MSGVRHLGMVQEPENVARVELCPRVPRAMGPVEPAAQLVSVYRPGHTHVLTVLAPIGPLDSEVDQIDELRSHLDVVVGSGQHPYQRFLRTPLLRVLCPLLWVPGLPFKEQQGEGQPRPRIDLPGGSPAPQGFGQTAACGLVKNLLGSCPVPCLVPQPRARVPSLVDPAASRLDLFLGTGQSIKGSGTFGRGRCYQAVSPRQSLSPPVVVVDARACHLRHVTDHRVIGTPAHPHMHGSGGEGVGTATKYSNPSIRQRPAPALMARPAAFNYLH